MTEIRFESEKELIEGVKQSQVYKEFSSKYLGPKIDRERKAFRSLAEHRSDGLRSARWRQNFDQKEAQRLSEDQPQYLSSNLSLCHFLP